MTPIFMRIWLRKITIVLERETVPLISAGPDSSTLHGGRHGYPPYRLQAPPLDKGRNGIHHQHIHRAGSHKRIRDLQSLFPRIGLAEEEVIKIDAQFTCITRIERVLRIHEGADTALFLRFRDGVERERRLAGTFRSINFDNPAARKPANAQRDIKGERTR